MRGNEGVTRGNEVFGVTRCLAPRWVTRGNEVFDTSVGNEG